MKDWMEKYAEDNERIERREMIWIGVACLLAALALYAWEYWV